MIETVCVVGAGAVGSQVAAKLARAGIPVSLLARGPQLSAIESGGLMLEGPDFAFTVTLPVSDDPATFGPQDLVIVALKGPALPSAIDNILPLLKNQTPIVFMLNGIPWWYFYREGGRQDGHRMERLDPGGRIWDRLGPERVLGCVVHTSCSVTRPGLVHVERNTSRLVVGEPDDSSSERVESVAKLLESGGFETKVTTDIRSAIWDKLMLNIATAPLAVLAQNALVDMYREPACAEATRSCLVETNAIARAFGRGSPELDVDAIMGRIIGSRHKPSLLQDLEASREMEIDAICDLPLDMARQAGIETPLLSLIVALTRLRARAAGLYPQRAVIHDQLSAIAKPAK